METQRFDKDRPAILLGGHTVRDPEIKFGYAVTGVVEPDQMLTNARGEAGQVVVLTKALGTGVIATALKAGQAPAEAAAASQRSMSTLNRIPAAVCHEILRQKKLHLGFSGHTATHDFLILCAGRSAAGQIAAAAA